MNYQDYQKNKERKFPIGAKVTPGDPIKIEKKHTPKRKILDILSEPQYPNLGAIVAVICMLVFWNTQIIPATMNDSHLSIHTENEINTISINKIPEEKKFQKIPI